MSKELTIEEQQKAVHARARADKPEAPKYVPSGEDDPEVVTIRAGAAARILFSGEDIVEVDLPPGSRVIYSKPPMRGLADPDEAIRHAVLNPEGMQPLPQYLKAGMKVTVCIDDISLPLPPMETPDMRQRILQVVLEYLDAAGVTDVHLIVATAFHRRMTNREIKRMTGPEIFTRFHPDRLYNHDAENKDGMKWLGHTETGEAVEINRRAAESDLVIYVNINFVPMNGGHKSVATGLAGYKTLREHHDPEVIANCNSYMDPGHSVLARSNARIGAFIENKVPVFHIESALNNRMFRAPLAFLAKNEDTYSALERGALSALKQSLKRLTPELKRKIFQRVYAPYEPIAVHAGHVDQVHERILKSSRRQYTVRIKEQADVLVLGIPFISPYSVNSILNPLLVQVMALGYLYHLYEGGVPLLRDGGALILFHPCRDEFDPKHHPSYIEFFHRILPETTDSIVLQKKYEREFATNPEYIKMYREGNAYHGVHPFYMWYWGETGRRKIGKVIAVGAQDKHVPERMGWNNASTFEGALEMAKTHVGQNPRIVMLHQPPVVVAKMV